SLVALFERAASVEEYVCRVIHMNQDIYPTVSCDISKCEKYWYLVGVIATDPRNHIQICFCFPWIAWDLNHFNDTMIVNRNKLTDRVFLISMPDIRVNLIGSWIPVFEAVCCPLPDGTDNAEEIEKHY